MKRKLLILSLFLLSLVSASAQELQKLGNAYVCKGEVAAQKDDRATFAASLLWSMEQEIYEKDGKKSVSIDAAIKTIVMKPILRFEDRQYHFEFEMGLQAKGDKLVYEIGNIRCIPAGFFGDLKVINFNKVNLDKRPQMRTYIDDFASLLPQYIENMAAQIRSTEVKLNHWEAIVEGKVVKGMNEQECIIILGKPKIVTENSQRKQWTYESGKVVVFENGIVVASM